MELMVTAVFPDALVQPLAIADTLYVPAAAVTLIIDGFCRDEVNPFGPVQKYVAPLTVLAVSNNVFPAHTGELLPAVGTDGTPGWALITTFPLAGDIHPDEFVTVKLYVPAARPVTIVLIPVPAIFPGLIVQLPDEGEFPASVALLEQIV